MNVWLNTLEAYGGHPDNLVWLSGDPSPESLPFTALYSHRASESRSDDERFLAIYQWHDAPLLLLINGEGLDSISLRRIRRRAALHGDIPYLGVLTPGQLTIHSVALDEAEVTQFQHASLSESILTLPRLGANRPTAIYEKRQWIANLILSLLDDALEKLIGTGIASDDAISLAGRALFSRFLADRELITKTSRRKVARAYCSPHLCNVKRPVVGWMTLLTVSYSHCQIILGNPWGPRHANRWITFCIVRKVVNCI